MFTVTKSKQRSIRASTLSEAPKSKSPNGVSSKGRTSSEDTPEGMLKSESSIMPTNLGPSTGVSANAINIDLDPLLQGITPSSEAAFMPMYHDIYLHDSVAGSAVDLISQITFSGEFTLGGISNSKVADVFANALDCLNTRSLFPEMSTDYLVQGVHCSSLLFDNNTRTFKDSIPHRAENLTAMDLPFYSQDPMIKVRFPADTIQSIANTEAEWPGYLDELVGKEILDKIRQGKLTLDPLTSIYIPRKAFSFSDQGVSYFRRLVPIHLIEKNLFRGTIVESARRQRGIMHLTLGDGEDWIPTVPDMEFMTDLFLNADSDPLGAIVTTRAGVAVEEIRQGGDFWKVTDFQDSILPYKLRALGISEGFLSGDASYNVADAAMTIFVEMLRSYRDMMTRKFFYDRVFPLISLSNGYTINRKGKLVINEGITSGVKTKAGIAKLLNEGNKLFIPSVSWNRQLKPEGDSAYMEMLNGMSEKGIPVPLRVLAAAGGMNLEDLLKQQEDDLELRKKIAVYKKEVDKLSPKPAGGGDEGFASSSFSGGSAVLSSRKGIPIPILDRPFDSEPYALSKTGKKKAVVSQSHARANERVNLLISKVATKLDKKKRPELTPFTPTRSTL